MNEIYYYFLLFLIYSFIGWLIEVIGKLIEKHKFINRGFLIGPICPIYGHGCILMILTLSRYKDNPLTLFIYAIFFNKFFKYNNFPKNINIIKVIVEIKINLIKLISKLFNLKLFNKFIHGFITI